LRSIDPVSEREIRKSFGFARSKRELSNLLNKLNKVSPGFGKHNDLIKTFSGAFSRESTYIAMLKGKIPVPAYYVQEYDKMTGVLKNSCLEPVWAESPWEDFYEKLERITAPCPRHHYYTVIWCEYIAKPSTAQLRFYYCRISKLALYKVSKRMKLSIVERGMLRNFPINISDGGGQYVHRMSGNYGQRPPTVQGVNPERASALFIMDRDIIERLPPVSQIIRVNGGRDAALVPFNRNGKRSECKYTEKDIARSVQILQKAMPQWTIPRIRDEFSVYDMINSAIINPNKLSGFVSRSSVGKDLKKSEYICEAHFIALKIADRFIRGDPVYDTSPYTAGGRPKTNWGKPEGSRLTGRPVWMASMIQEFFSSYINELFISYSRCTGATHPHYLGKNLDQMGWTNLVRYVRSPKRKCYHGDYSKWDSTVAAPLVRYVFGILRQMLPDRKEFDLMIDFIYSGFARHPLVTLGGGMVYFRHGVPSGHKLTSLVNSLCNYLIVAINYRECRDADRIRREDWPSLAMGFCGDDFFVVSCDEKYDALVERMGRNSVNVAKKLDMELDPPYTGDFAVEDPDEGGFEFLKTRFTVDMVPTIASINLLKRYMCSEKFSTDRNVEYKLKAIETAPCHPNGIRIWTQLASNLSFQIYSGNSLMVTKDSNAMDFSSYENKFLNYKSKYKDWDGKMSISDFAPTIFECEEGNILKRSRFGEYRWRERYCDTALSFAGLQSSWLLENCTYRGYKRRCLGMRFGRLPVMSASNAAMLYLFEPDLD